MHPYVTVFCECDGEHDCFLQLQIPREDYNKAIKAGCIFILDGCQNGPLESDTLYKTMSGYKIYKPDFSMIYSYSQGKMIHNREEFTSEPKTNNGAGRV